MAHKIGNYTFGFFLLLAGSQLSFGAAEQVKKLRFIPGAANSELEIQFSGNIHFNVQELASTRQVIVEAEHVMLAPEQTKIIDASSTDSPVIQITPYNAGGKEHNAKFVVQLKAPAKISSHQLPGKFVLEIQGSSKFASIKMDPVPSTTKTKKS